METAVPPSFLCPIGKEIMRDPVTTVDGHSYERASIERWLARNSTSPATGTELHSKTLAPNHALRNSMEEWLSANFKLVPRTAIDFDEAAIAGGSFKSVHVGTVKGRSERIAVLRMRAGRSCEEEAAKLVRLARHPSLVRYVGVCTEGPEQLLLTELAPLGSLTKFLEGHEDEDEVTLAHKLEMLKQISAGMIALSGAGLVHRDLAARNILVFAFDAGNPEATVVKITDFGLAVDREYETHATVEGEGAPLRWMPPEALRRRRFSEKSDVWAFGVMAWELLTGGDMPYAFIDSLEAVAERVCGGERLARPALSPDALWRLLQRTWAPSPAERPTFAEIAGELAHMQHEMEEEREEDEEEEKEEGRMRIFIRPFVRGKSRAQTNIMLDVEPCDSIDNIKWKILGANGISPFMQRLIFAGRELEDGYSLSDYHIHHHSALYLLISFERSTLAEFAGELTESQRERDGEEDASKILIMPLASGESRARVSIVLEIEPFDSIENIKWKILGATGTPSSKQCLFSTGRVRNTCTSLSDYIIQHHSTLYLVSF